MAIRFDPDDLKEASLEKIETARRLFTVGDDGAKHYSSAIYLAGVRVLLSEFMGTRAARDDVLSGGSFMGALEWRRFRRGEPCW